MNRAHLYGQLCLPRDDESDGGVAGQRAHGAAHLDVRHAVQRRGVHLEQLVAGAQLAALARRSVGVHALDVVMGSQLYGYTRSFEQATADMVEALKMGEFVIIGITDTDSNGAIVGGHEITLTGAFVDKKDGEIKFEVVDSDDDIPTPVIRSAKELIPRIHHAGMPNKLAQKINKDMEGIKGYYVPGAEDRAQFTPMEMLNEPLPADMVEPQPEVAVEPTPVPSKPAKSQVSSAPAPPTPHAAPRPEPIPQPAPQQVEYVPVYAPPANYPMYPYQPMAYQPVPYQPIYTQAPQYAAPYGYGYPQPAMNPFMMQYPQGYPQQQPYYPGVRNAA